MVKRGKAKVAKSDVFDELRATMACVEALEKLPPGSVRRVVVWLGEHYKPTLTTFTYTNPTGSSTP